jgi:BirA family transcriptional regulator, biotin operon repressor / biotin---[acetyl-CoA-carboxylase] ligase
MPGTRFTDVRRFGTIDSTNRYLLDEARAGAAEGVVAVADHQTAGRGRMGRRWLAPPGANLLVSVLLRPGLSPGSGQLAASVVALAAAEAVDEVAGVEVGIKWPNDLLAADGRKVAGVLAEADVAASSPAPGLFPPIVVGIGINVNWPEKDSDLGPELVGSATSLRQQAGHRVDTSALLDALLTHLEPRVADLGSEAGQARQAADLLVRCTTVGTRVRVELAGETLEGTATGITPGGHLTVDVGGQPRTVVAGDVVHLRPPA